MKSRLTRTTDKSVIDIVKRIERKTGERIEKTILNEARIFLRKGVASPGRKVSR